MRDLEIDEAELRAELARRKLTKARLARKIGVAPSTLSGWLVGNYPGPADLSARVEKALGLKPGTLAVKPPPKKVA